MADIKKLAEKRAALLTDASALVSAQAEKGEALEGEAQARFEALTTEAGQIAAAIKSERDAAEARSAADAVRAEYAAAVAPKTNETADDAAELRRLGREGGERNFEYRDVVKSTGLGNPVSVAGMVNVIAGQVNPFLNPDVVDIIRASTGNQILLPRVTALGTAGSVSEAGAIGESDGTLSNLALTPVKYATLLQISGELINDAAFDISGFVAEKAGQEVGIAHGAVAGTAVAAAATIGVTGATTVYSPTYANLVDLVYSVKQQYRRAPKRGFLMNDATLGGIIKLLDSQNRPIFIPGDLSKPDTVLGFPVYSAALADSAANALNVAFGDLGAIKTVLVGGVDIASSADFAFNYGLVTYRIQVRGVTGLIEASAVKTFKGGAAS
jgi:HK97 family phage major capsid protein